MADPETEQEESVETLWEAVEEKYDFDDFGPADMAEITVEEWEAVFEPDSWITGPELLDRVEADLKDKVTRREVFAVVERGQWDGDERLLAYTDEGYALVHPDGTVEGEGSVLRDVEPIVALCSMDAYEVPPMPEGDLLPSPEEITAGSGELGNRLMLAVGIVQLIAGLVLLIGPFVIGVGGSGSILLSSVAGLGFIVIGVVILILVANARLSDRFRAEEYRERLRAAGVGADQRPPFVPIPDSERDDDG